MSQKKRELGQNELADILGAKLDEWRPYLPIVAIVVAGLLLAIVIGLVWINARQTAIARQWANYFFAIDQAYMNFGNRGLQAVAEDNPDSEAGQIARVFSGDTDYVVGMSEFLSNRDSSRRRLEAARDSYLEVVENPRHLTPAMLRRATFALANAYEALGDFENARRYYQQLTQLGEDEPLVELARRALERVEDPQVAAVFTAFRSWQPEAEAPGPLLPQRPDIGIFDDLEFDPNQIDAPRPEGQEQMPRDPADDPDAAQQPYPDDVPGFEPDQDPDQRDRTQQPEPGDLREPDVPPPTQPPPQLS